MDQKGQDKYMMPTHKSKDNPNRTQRPETSGVSPWCLHSVQLRERLEDTSGKRGELVELEGPVDAKRTRQKGCEKKD